MEREKRELDFPGKRRESEERKRKTVAWVRGFNFQGHIEERESASESVSNGRKERKLSSHK